MSKNLRRMVTFGLVVTMGILPMSAHSNIVQKLTNWMTQSIQTKQEHHFMI